MNVRIAKTLTFLAKNYPKLANDVDPTIMNLDEPRKREINTALELGFRGFGQEILEKTEARALCRSVMMCSHIRENTPLTTLRAKWSRRRSIADIPELRRKLEELISSLPERSAVTPIIPTTAERMAKINGVKMGGPPLDMGPLADSKKSSDGRHHPVYIYQQKASNCGPTCVRMVSHLNKGVPIGVDYIEQEIEKAENTGLVSKIASGTGPASQGGRDWIATGTWYLGAALKSLKIKFEQLPEHSNVTDAMQRTTYEKPAIAVVKWANGGGLHWVVIAGPLKINGSKSYLIMDPVYGIKEVDSTMPKPSYQVPGTTGEFTGQMFLIK